MLIFPNGKKYIGITSYSLNVRFKKDGSGYKKQPVYNAIKKYGWQNIIHEVLLSELTKEEAEQKEMELIKVHNTLLQNGMGYNSATGGGVNSGFKIPEKTKELLRKIPAGWR